MKKFYGSLSNRLDENKYFNGTYNNIKVGDYATEYLYSDSHAYEVVEVIDQKHLFIRRLKAIRIDKNGMSDSQSYKYEKDENSSTIELEQDRFGKWKTVHRYDLELYNKVVKEIGFVLWGSDVVEKVLAGKKVKRSFPINISFGIADEYFDYSF